MRVPVSVPSANGRLRVAALLAIAVFVLTPAPATAETLPEALVRTYQGNPALNAERARQRGTDENVPQALSGYRPQIVASLTAGLQAVRVLLPDNTIQTATLRTWTIGFTVSQTLFNGFKTANTVRQSEAQVQSGREALRNIGQGVLLDAVTAYMNVLANQSLVEAQRINVDLSARDARHHPQTARRRRRHADRRGAGRGAAEPRARRSQCRRGRARGQPGDLRAGRRRAAGPADAAGLDRPAAAARARRRRSRSAARRIPRFSRRRTTSTSRSTAPRSRRAACGRTLGVRAPCAQPRRPTPRSSTQRSDKASVLGHAQRADL